MSDSSAGANDSGQAPAQSGTLPETPPETAVLPSPVVGPVSAAADAAVVEAIAPEAAAVAPGVGARERMIGIALVLIATLGWSLSGLFMRLLEEPDPWRSNGYRGLSMATAMAVYLCWRYRGGLGRLLRATPAAAVIMGGGFFALGSTLYLAALSMAPVANVAALGATAPLFAALLARLVLGERAPPSVLLAVAVAIGGIVFMMADQLALDAGAWAGQLVALAVAFCFAGQTVALRRFRGVEMMPAFVLGGLLTAAILLSLVPQSLPSRHDLAIMVLMGVVQLAIPIACYARGARYLPAVQLSLLALLDVVFNPLWAWLAVGETPTPETVLGGCLIVLAVAGIALRREKRPG